MVNTGFFYTDTFPNIPVRSHLALRTIKIDKKELIVDLEIMK